MDNLLMCLSGALQELSDLLPPPLSVLLLGLGICIWRLLRENAKLRVREAMLMAELTESAVTMVIATKRIKVWKAMLLKAGVEI